MSGRRAWTALALALALAGCKQSSRTGIALDASIEKLIPADTVVLAGARLEQMRATTLYQRLMGEQKIAPLDEFAKKTGLDPRRDLIELVIASNGKDALMIARVRIGNPSTLEALLEKEGAKRTVFEGHTLLGSESGAVVFLNGGLVAAGRPAQLKEALAGKSADDTKKKAVLGKSASLPADRHIWVVAMGGFPPMPLPETGNLANLNRVFQSLDTVTMTLDLKQGISLSATGLCNNDKDAKQLHDMLRGLIGFGRLSTPTDQPEMLRFFDGIKVDHRERTVKLNADVPMDMVDYFLKLTERGKGKA
ncbi:MAG: hypothetical protein HY235_05985 [Acidobacteria bacterium]|nr:hypothetical protein [Acidobacteriota bacterium]